MTVKAKFSNSFHAKMARIQRLPQMIEGTMMGQMKSSATGVIEEFKKGLRMNNMGLEKLKDATIASKTRKGYEKPENPLYGLGDRSDKSYINMMRIRKIKNGYKVYPSKGKHHSSGLSLADLFKVHEYGCTVNMKSGATVRIPPRPAFFKAYERQMLKMKKDAKETSRTVKKAMTEFINTAKRDLLYEIERKDLMNHEDYEKND
jgi:hypothetical protein